MKNFQTFLFLTFGLPFLFFILGCCRNQNFILIGVENFTIYDEIQHTQVEILRKNPFYIKIRPKTEFVGYMNSISSLYATTCPEYIKNCIKENSLKLSIDKEVRFGSKTILANTDLIKELNPEVKNDYLVCNDATGWNSEILIKFNKKKVDSLGIEPGFSKLKLTYETSDNKLIIFEKEISIKF